MICPAHPGLPHQDQCAPKPRRKTIKSKLITAAAMITMIASLLVVGTGTAPAAPASPPVPPPPASDELRANPNEPGIEGDLLGRPSRGNQRVESTPQPDGQVRHQASDGTVLYTHGPDPVAFHGGSTSNGPLVEGTKYGRCASTTSSKRFLLVYAYPFDRPNNSANSVDLIRKAFVTGADQTGKWQESRTGAVLQQKVHCSSTGTPQVTVVKLPTHSSQATYSTITSDLRALGATNDNIKYMVSYDAPISYDPNLGGEGAIHQDDIRTTSNKHNQESEAPFPLFALDYNGVQDLTDPGLGFGSVLVFRHEMGHTMGAVQKSAPNHANGNHCNVEHDLMCYTFDPASEVNACAVSGPEPFDCTLNIYAAAAHINDGPYLEQKWNVAGCRNDFVRISSGQCNSFYDTYGYN